MKIKHEMGLQQKYYDLIASGIKVYEVRLYDEKRKNIKIGDNIIFFKEPDRVERLKTMVEEIKIFPSFEEMLKVIDVNEIGFNNEEHSSILEIYHKFYSSEEENKHGVVAIKVKVISE